MSCVTVNGTATAWDMIGAGGLFRVQGGRVLFECVAHNDASARSDNVLLCGYLGDGGGRSRYVGPDTILEVLELGEADVDFYADKIHDTKGEHDGN